MFCLLFFLLLSLGRRSRSMHTHNLGCKFVLHWRPSSFCWLFSRSHRMMKKKHTQNSKNNTRRREKTIKEQWTQPTTTRHNNHLIIISAFGPVLEHINFMRCFNFSDVVSFFSFSSFALFRFVSCLWVVALFHWFLYDFMLEIVFFLFLLLFCLCNRCDLVFLSDFYSHRSPPQLRLHTYFQKYDHLIVERQLIISSFFGKKKRAKDVSNFYKIT